MITYRVRSSIIANLMVAAIVLCGTPTAAKHPRNALRAVPDRDATDVPTNVKLFFAIYGPPTDNPASMLEGATLKTRGHKVRLVVERLPSSQLSVSTLYIVLKPTAPLKPKRKYRLRTRPPGRADSKWLRNWLRMFRRDVFHTYGFTTGRGPDRQAPQTPRPEKATYHRSRSSIGLAESVMIELSGLQDDHTPVKSLRVRLDVEETMPQQPGVAPKAKRFQIFSEAVSGPIERFRSTYLGYGGWHGNYELIKGARYGVRVAVVDYAGNTSAPGPPIEFAVPSKP